MNPRKWRVKKHPTGTHGGPLTWTWHVYPPGMAVTDDILFLFGELYENDDMTIHRTQKQALDEALNRARTNLRKATA